jgi:glutamine synthetase
MNNKICLEYVWIGGKKELRSKTKVMNINNGSELTVQDLPLWNFDGSSTGQATGEDSEVILKPIRLFNDPLRKGGIIVLCETYTAKGEVHHRKGYFEDRRPSSNCDPYLVTGKIFETITN